MKYYKCQVRFMEGGQPKAVIHKEYAATAAAAANQVAISMAESPVVVFSINEHDKFVLFTRDVLNVSVIAGS